MGRRHGRDMYHAGYLGYTRAMRPSIRRKGPCAPALGMVACLAVLSSTSAASPPKASTATASPTTAQPASPDLAEQLYAKLEYEEANKTADALLHQRDLPHADLVRATRILAITHASLDRPDAARAAFILLLAYEPDFASDPNLGPKVSSPFVEARGFWRAQASRPGLEVTAQLQGAEPGALRIVLRDPIHVVQRVEVGSRWSPDLPFTTKVLPASAALSFDVPPPPAGRSRLDYYAVATDARGHAAFEAGSPALPKSALVEAKAAPPGATMADTASGGSIFASPFFWITTGVVLAGGAAAGYYFLARPKDPATSTVLTPQLTCGGLPCN